ncbi:MAG: hypothetical protein SF051_14730 [Elusimicrobiota bacterium]|nr:hypothetical protein [Elusimicrobiota bacterium]
MKRLLALAVAAFITPAPSFADELPGAQEAQAALRGAAAAFQAAPVGRAPARPVGRPVSADYSAQVSCYRSGGGTFREQGGMRVAVVRSGAGGVPGTFTFTTTTLSFRPDDASRAAPSEAAVLSGLNAALVERMRSVDSIDPTSFAHSRCGELLPAPTPFDG